MIFSAIFAFAIVASALAGTPTKRGLFDGNFGNFGGGFASGNNFAGASNFAGHNDLGFGSSSVQGLGGLGHQGFGGGQQQLLFAKPIIIHKVVSNGPVSPAEIAAAISAAKEATSQVLQAQHRVQVAKEAVLHQQRLASQKETQATIAAQKAEAAAAVQRQEANAAATAVVLAQQRLAQAKAEVAEQQRIAASRESQAANVIQRSASAAAEEIQRSEHNAAKLASFQRPDANAYRNPAKDTTLSAASAAVAASASHYPSHDALPWQSIRIGHWHH